DGADAVRTALLEPRAPRCSPTPLGRSVGPTSHADYPRPDAHDAGAVSQVATWRETRSRRGTWRRTVQPMGGIGGVRSMGADPGAESTSRLETAVVRDA